MKTKLQRTERIKRFAIALLLAALAGALATTVLAAAGPAPPQAARLHVVMAQVGTLHTATLSWTLSTDDTTANCAAPSACSQNVYRAPSSCTAIPLNLMKYASVPATAAGYVDITPLFGNSCYAVSFVINGTESGDSNTAGGSLSPAAPTGFAATYK